MGNIAPIAFVISSGVVEDIQIWMCKLPFRGYVSVGAVGAIAPMVFEESLIDG